jgi:hypothetical protein
VTRLSITTILRESRGTYHYQEETQCSLVRTKEQAGRLSYIPSPHKPIYYNNPQNTFIRFGSGDQRATNGEITAMFHNQSFGIKSEQILLDSDLSMLNEDTIRDYRNYFKLYSPRPNLIGNDIADFCKRIGIADNEGHLNYGGNPSNSSRPCITSTLILMEVSCIRGKLRRLCC